MNKFFAFLFLLFFSTTMQAQVNQLGRIELPIQSDLETYSVVPLDTLGIVLFRKFIGDKGEQLELTRLDTSLHQLWKGYVPLPNGLLYVGTKAFDGNIYFFFKTISGVAKNFYAVVLSANGNYSGYKIENLIPFNATQFVANKGSILIGGYFNFRPVVLLFSLKDQHSRVLPGFLNEPGEITQIKPYPDGSTDVIVSAKNIFRKKCLWIRHFDQTGDLIQTVVLEPGEHKNLIFGRAAKMDSGNQVIAGVYGRNSEYSRGIFVAEINAYGEYAIRYYNFAELKNFFHYMKARREKRIKDRIERRKVKGKKIKFNYRFLVHELMPYGNQFVMLGEAFYPTYSNRSNFVGSAGSYSPWSYGLNSNNLYRSSYRSDMVFDGFEYTHAVVIGFDNQGKLVWDNSFEINGVKSFYLEQFVKIIPEKNKIEMIYLIENSIRSKAIRGVEVVEGTMQDPIATFNNAETKIIKTQQTKLEYWYSNHLIVYGVQNYIQVDASIGRKVFFINKLSCH